MITESTPPPSQDELVALRAEVAKLRELERRSQQVIRDLGDAVAARDAFIAIAGHELRNPMGAILLAATNLVHVAAQKRDTLPPWISPRLAALERQARTFVRRATTLLDVSRITSGNLRLEREIVDLADVVRTALDLLGAELERAGSPLTTSVEGSVCGWWDRVALEQVINLLSNAIKYGAGRPIRITLGSDGTRATLTVADQGIGISEADRGRVFARFERAVTQRAHGGFGLGLWISHELVEALGGVIRVESELGVGSMFTVELPQEVEKLPR